MKDSILYANGQWLLNILVTWFTRALQYQTTLLQDIRLLRKYC